ncbi:hypothetical protein [Mucilaginibacter paludis]|uniref:Uncharacterized protein n=1 Tax=Mucilaginibacter paludis DSM 18603 TaxID=714943 RepID=H1YAG1_9SPHI|nr:hypothetical protein [Mucilaginibacter paludis]EHQ27004.1 hypothetical protein Mucpa_2895 [Mucilaginibacter paludis DSM 18603]
MKENINDRIEAGMQDWRKTEQRSIKIFGPGVVNNVVLMKEKLKHFDYLLGTHKNLNFTEKISRDILKAERNILEKKLYPKQSLLMRFVRRFVRRRAIQQQFGVKEKIATPVLSQPVKVTQPAIKRKPNLEFDLIKNGLGAAIPLIRENVQYGLPRFQEAVLVPINEREQMRFILNFSRDVFGEYTWFYKASLKNKDEPGVVKSVAFTPEQSRGLTTQQAYHLLCGRSVLSDALTLKERENVQNNTAILKLDFNDTDETGNYRMKMFDSHYAYNDLKTVIERLPIKDGHNYSVTNKIHTALVNGSREPVTLLVAGKEKKVFLESDVQNKSIKIFDEKLKQITWQNAVEGKVVDMKTDRKEKQGHEKSTKKGLHVSA